MCKSWMCSGSGPALGRQRRAGVGSGGASTRTVEMGPGASGIRRAWGDSTGARGRWGQASCSEGLAERTAAGVRETGKRWSVTEQPVKP